MDTLPLGTTHCTHVLLWSVCPFLHWAGYFPPSLIIHLTSLHLHLIRFIKLMSTIVHLVILAGIPAILTHLPHLILLAVPLIPLLPIPLVLQWMSLCILCEKICLKIPLSLFSLYTSSPLIIMHDYFI